MPTEVFIEIFKGLFLLSAGYGVKFLVDYFKEDREKKNYIKRKLRKARMQLFNYHDEICVLLDMLEIAGEEDKHVDFLSDYCTDYKEFFPEFNFEFLYEVAGKRDLLEEVETAKRSIMYYNKRLVKSSEDRKELEELSWEDENDDYVAPEYTDEIKAIKEYILPEIVKLREILEVHY